jgi:hypothetical protein
MTEFDSTALESAVTDDCTDVRSDDVIVAGDDAEILDKADNGEDRPEDCQCWDPDGELPCWPCYREGFRSQNPTADPE